MARPTKIQARRKALGKDAPALDPFHGMTDPEVLNQIHDRFDLMSRLTDGAMTGDVRAFIVSGAPGVGKTYNVEQKLTNKYQEVAGSDDDKRFRYVVIKGAITPVHLYKTLWSYRFPGCVVCLDDADSIFFHDDGVSLLKAALDSTPQRVLTWASETNALKDEMGGEIPTSFEFKGTMIFITNTNFQGIVDKGTSKLAPHFEALLSRSMYLDLKIHSRRAIAIWVNYLVSSKKILQSNFGITSDQERQAVDWILENQADLRTLSIRDAMKVGQLMASDYDSWQRDAEILLVKDST